MKIKLAFVGSTVSALMALALAACGAQDTGISQGNEAEALAQALTVTGTLVSGATLQPGDSLVSPNGQFTLKLDSKRTFSLSDHAKVIYALYSTQGAYGTVYDAQYAKMDTTGNFVLYGKICTAGYGETHYNTAGEIVCNATVPLIKLWNLNAETLSTGPKGTPGAVVKLLDNGYLAMVSASGVELFRKFRATQGPFVQYAYP